MKNRKNLLKFLLISLSLSFLFVPFIKDVNRIFSSTMNFNENTYVEEEKTMTNKKKLNDTLVSQGIIVTEQKYFSSDLKFSSLTYGDVEAQSWLLNQLIMMKDGLTGDFEEVSPFCTEDSPWRKGLHSLDDSTDFERVAYYVRGLTALAGVLKDDSLMAKAKVWIDAAIESQVDSGAFGPQAKLMDVIDFWPVTPMVMAIEQYYEMTLDDRIISFLTNYYNYVYNKLTSGHTYGYWANARGGDNIFALLWLYEKTNDESLLDICDVIYQNTFDWEKAYDKDAWKEVYHIVNVQESFKLFPVMYAITNDESYLDTYYKGIENLYMASGREDGMANGDEYTRGISSLYGSETCSVVERIISDQISLTYTKDASIADHLENIGYNALPQQLLPDTNGQVYFSMQNQISSTYGKHNFTSDGGNRNNYGCPGGFPCCIHNYHIGWPAFVSSMWMKTNDNGLAVGAYGPNKVHAVVGDDIDAIITQETNYPYDEDVKLKLNLDKSGRFPLYLRTPSWCKNATLKINDEVVDYKLTPNEYICLEKDWNDGDVVTLTFPMTFQYNLTENNSVSIRYGAVLFAYGLDEIYTPVTTTDGDNSGWPITGKYKIYDITSNTPWNYALSNFNFNNLSSNFEIIKNDISSSMKFQTSNAPIKLKVKAKQVNTWVKDTIYENIGPIPVSPVDASTLGNETDIYLIPYAFTRLRITLMPWTNTTGDFAQVYYQSKSRSNSSCSVIENIIIPSTPFDTGGYFNTYYANINYSSKETFRGQIYVNKQYLTDYIFEEGGGALSIPQYDLSYDYHNLIEIKPVGRLLPSKFDTNVTVTVTHSEKYLYKTNDTTKVNLLGSPYRGPSYPNGLISVDHSGYGISFNVNISEANYFDFKLYYACPVDNGSICLKIDNEFIGRYDLKQTDFPHQWDNYDTRFFKILTTYLSSGNHNVQIVRDELDTGSINLWKVEVNKSLSLKTTIDPTKCILKNGVNVLEKDKLIGGFDNVNAEVSMVYNAPEDSTYNFNVKYSAPLGNAYLGVYLDGQYIKKITFDKTNTDFYHAETTSSISLGLSKGTHKISLIKVDADAGFPTLGEIKLSYYQGSSYSALDARRLGNVALYGDGLANFDNVGDGAIFKTYIDIPTSYTMKTYYASPMGDATLTLYVDDVKIGKINFTGPVGGWGSFSNDVYSSSSLPNMSKGFHDIKIIREDDDAGYVNIGSIILIENKSFDAEVINPTCNTEGYTIHTSNDGSETYKDNYINELGHDFSQPTYSWNSDYTKLTASNYCLNDITHVQTETVNVTSSVIKEPTCEEVGYKLCVSDSFTTDGFFIQSCVIQLDKLPHTPSQVVIENVIDPDCTHSGSHDEVVYCDECGGEISRTTVTDPATGHSYGEWSVTQKATCIEKGSEHRYCSECGEEEIRDINPLGHDYEETWTVDVEPTCEHEGSKSHHCSRCDAKTDVTVIDKLDHNPTSPVKENEVPATCTEDGSYDEVIYCEDCKAEISREHKTITSTGHSYGEWIPEIPPTYENDGVKGHYHCDKCNKNFDINHLEIENIVIEKLHYSDLLKDMVDNFDNTKSLENQFSDISDMLTLYHSLDESEKELFKNYKIKLENIIVSYNNEAQLVEEQSKNNDLSYIICASVLSTTLLANLGMFIIKKRFLGL